MKLKTAHVIYFEYKSDKDEDFRIMDSIWDYCVEYYDDEIKFATRKTELLNDSRSRNVEVYHGTIMKSHEESEA